MSDLEYVNWEGIAEERKASILQLADVFHTCAECFGLIHAGKKARERSYEVAMAQLGIEQARLLAWGDAVGIMVVSASRDEALEKQEQRAAIEKEIRSIIELHTTHSYDQHFKTYGLKHMIIPIYDLEVALDWVRLEALREKYELLGQIRRTPPVKGPHWSVTDLKKLRIFIAQVQLHINNLIGLFENGTRVDQAMKADIKALGWHPAFFRQRAAADGAKLQLIKEACKETYPEYSATTTPAMEYLDKEWAISYEEALGQAKKQHALNAAEADAMKQAKVQAAMAEAVSSRQYSYVSVSKPSSPKPTPPASPASPGGTKKSGNSGFFAKLRPKGWKRHSMDDTEPQRSMSYSDAHTVQESEAKEDLAENMIPIRSNSLAGLSEPGTIVRPFAPQETPIVSDKKSIIPENEPVVQPPVESPAEHPIDDLDLNQLEPIKSLISRNDKWCLNKV